jgi:hypothetical protein
MITFTFIMQFREGIYVRQAKGNNLKQGVNNWAQALSDIKHFGKQAQTELIGIVSQEVPIAITGLINVWCLSLSLKVGFVLVNIIQTEIND